MCREASEGSAGSSAAFPEGRTGPCGLRGTQGMGWAGAVLEVSVPIVSQLAEKWHCGVGFGMRLGLQLQEM